MKMSAEMREDFLLFMEGSGALIGRHIQVSEAICTTGLGFNRHGTTFSDFGFTLQSCTWRISGGRVMLLSPVASYEIGADQLISFKRLGATDFEFIEQYAPTVFRRTRLVIGT